MTYPPDWTTVEIRFGTFFGVDNWVDVGPWVQLDQGAATSRGRQTEGSEPQVGSFSCTLNNSDGRFTPGLSTSPYYPYVTDGAPVRVTCRVPQGVNLEDNPSHEQGTGEWLGVGGTPPTLSQSDTHIQADGGSWAMLITWGTTAGQSGAQRRVYGLTVGATYTVSRYVYVPTGSPDVRLVADSVNGTATSTKDAWVRVSCTFTATSTSIFYQVQSQSATAGQQCFTDAGQVEAGSSATTYSPLGALLVDRFFGFALEWPTGWDGGNTAYATSRLVAVDVLSRLGDRAGTLQPFDVEEQLLDDPLTCLPLAEPSGATQAGNLGAVLGAGTVANAGGGGAIEFSGGTGPPADGTSSLVLTPSAGQGYYLQVPTELFATAVTVEAFINSSTASGTIVDLAQSRLGNTYAGAGMTLSVDSGKNLEWRSDAAGLVVTSPADVADGQTRHVAATYVHSGTQHTATLFVDGVQVATGSVASTWTLVAAKWVLVGGGGKLARYTGTINHVAVYSTALATQRIAAHYHAGVDGFGGERSEQRVSRLASYAGLESLVPELRTGVGVWDSATLGVWDSAMVWADSDLDLEVGSATVYGQSTGGSTPLAAIREVDTTEGGLTLAGRDGRLDFQSRTHRYNRTPTVILDVTDDYVSYSIAPAYDDQDVVNDVTASTQDGAEVRYVDQASVDQRGTYQEAVSLLTRDPDDAYAAAGWRVGRRSAPRTKFVAVTVDLWTLPVDMQRLILALDVGDRVDLAGLPSQAPASSAALFVEGTTESLGPDRWSVTFNTSSADGFAVGVWNSPALGVWDDTFIWAY